MAAVQKITPFLWFDTEAEEAAKYYVSIFKNSKLGKIGRYGEAGKETHRRPVGSVMVVEFTLEGQRFMALNGGPNFKFNEAISLYISCKDQAEIDYYWNKLTQGGDPAAQQCGWLKDKYGLSWQVALERMEELVGDPNDPASQRAMDAMMETPPDRRHITICVEARAAKFEISVRDTGPGLRKEIVGSLFTPFVSTKPHGVGIGLAIVRTIVDAHEGKTQLKPFTAGQELHHVRRFFTFGSTLSPSSTAVSADSSAFFSPWYISSCDFGSPGLAGSISQL
jgi:predicted 3-demethylubiquinone-9 3-methyltransferase (glyoxalase superfamily)